MVKVVEWLRDGGVRGARLKGGSNVRLRACVRWRLPTDFWADPGPTSAFESNLGPHPDGRWAVGHPFFFQPVAVKL